MHECECLCAAVYPSDEYVPVNPGFSHLDDRNFKCCKIIIIGGQTSRAFGKKVRRSVPCLLNSHFDGSLKSSSSSDETSQEVGGEVKGHWSLMRESDCHSV